MAKRKPPGEWEIKMAGRFRQLRQRARLTQEALARKVDVGVKAVYLWERGLRTPTLKTASRVAEALDVTVGQLAGTEPITKRKEK
jgi:transcriptional regulator with XRE-family HTH domain